MTDAKANLIGYYQFLEDDDMTCIAVVRRDFWEREGCLDDQGGDDWLLPDGLDELMESHYEYERIGSKDDVRKLMSLHGWEERELY